MIRRLVALFLLSSVSLIQTAVDPHLVSLTGVNVGGNVTLQCPISLGSFFHWFKQPLGHMVQTLATGTLRQLKLSEQFDNPRFKVTEGKTQYLLTIRNISKEDEATYFCFNGTAYSQSFINGIFLAVNDRNEQKSFYVKQRPNTEFVQLGDKVNLQCSLHSKSQENKVQCAGEHSVYWFRYGSGESHPSIIYSVEAVERSCVYSWSKTIQNSSDTGTYYCAVVTCGEILFGEGTQVETRSKLDPVVLVLGVLLLCCVTVIIVLSFYVNRRRVCEHCKAGETSNPGCGRDTSTVDQPTDLDGDGEAVNYAALNFSARKVKREKNRELPTECVYSTVRSDNYTRPTSRQSRARI